MTHAKDTPGQLSYATLYLIAFTVGMDMTGAMILIPAIEAEYGADVTTTQWVLNAYALTYGMFMVAGGRLGDLFGRRRVMLIGLCVFILGAAACAAAPTVLALILARALQGVGSALAWPNMIGLGATLTTGERRGWVMGLIMAFVNLGNVVGPLLGGVVLSYADWRLFFGANVAGAALCILLCLKLLPAEGPTATDEKVDVAGIATLGLAVFAVLIALDVGSDWGWTSPRLLGLLAVGAVLFAILPKVESWVPSAMIPPPWMRRREFYLMLFINGFAMPACYTALLYFPQYIHTVFGWSSIWISVGMLPLLVPLGVASILSGRLYNLLGAKLCVSIGFGLIIFASGYSVLMDPAWGYPGLVPPMLILALGAGFVVGPAGTATVSSASEENASLVSGLGFMTHMAVGAMGVAGTTAVLNAVSLRHLLGGVQTAGLPLTPSEVDTVRTSGTGGLDKLSGAETETLQTLLGEAFVAGFQTASIIGLACAVAGLACVLFLDFDRLKRALGGASAEVAPG